MMSTHAASRLGAALLLTVLVTPFAFAGEQGTTLVGQRDAAVGLYLLPWKEEDPSDIDRPPRRFDAAGGPVDPAQFSAQVRSDQANAAYRRVRLEPR